MSEESKSLPSVRVDQPVLESKNTMPPSNLKGAREKPVVLQEKTVDNLAELRSEYGGQLMLMAEAGEAFVQPHVGIADLPAWRTSSALNDEKFVDPEPAIPLSKLYEEEPDKFNIVQKLEKTNWRVIDEHIAAFLTTHPDVAKSIGITSLNEPLHPASVATMAMEIAARNITYAYELVEEYYEYMEPEWKQKIDDLRAQRNSADHRFTSNGNPVQDFFNKENARYDEMTPDQILENRRGVCRQYSQVATAIYERAKQMQPDGPLKNTFLVPTYTADNGPAGIDTERHAFDLLIAHKGNLEHTMIGIMDPTWYIPDNTTGHEIERFAEARLISALQFATEHGLDQQFNIPKQELTNLIDGQLDRIRQLTTESKDRVNNTYGWINPTGIKIINGYFREKIRIEKNVGVGEVDEVNVLTQSTTYMLNLLKGLDQGYSSLTQEIIQSFNEYEFASIPACTLLIQRISQDMPKRSEQKEKVLPSLSNFRNTYKSIHRSGPFGIRLSPQQKDQFDLFLKSYEDFESQEVPSEPTTLPNKLGLFSASLEEKAA